MSNKDNLSVNKWFKTNNTNTSLNCGSCLVHLLFPGQDGHRGTLTCLACNKDSSLVLTGSVDGRAKLINTATGKVRVTTTP